MKFRGNIGRYLKGCLNIPQRLKKWGFKKFKIIKLKRLEFSFEIEMDV